jgi:hypothetical protein
MSQVLELGLNTGTVTMDIPSNAAFTRTLTLKDKTTGAPIDWGVGTTLTIIFSDPASTTLAATIASGGASPDAVFTFTTALSNLIGHGTGVRIQYVNGADDYPIWEGTVRK